MPFYQKKPVIITAIRYTGDNLKEVLEFTGKHPKFSEWFTSFEDYEKHVKHDRNAFKVITNHGSTEALPGDWIIMSPTGEFYPCTNAVFEATYELVVKKQS